MRPPKGSTAVALLAVSFGARVKHGVRWAAIPFGLVVAQFFLAYAAYSAPVAGLLHGLNALAVFAVALLAARRPSDPRSSARRPWVRFHPER
jgi:hypothetical protein